jgi:hypothetical protein
MTIRGISARNKERCLPMPDHDTSGGTRDQLAPEMLLYGFVRAVGRFTRSGLSEEPLAGPDDAPDLDRQVLAVEWGTAVFEALNWSVTLDGHLRWTWLSRGGVDFVVGWSWWCVLVLGDRCEGNDDCHSEIRGSGPQDSVRS